MILADLGDCRYKMNDLTVLLLGVYYHNRVADKELGRILEILIYGSIKVWT
jgi:hypothetical protein